MCVARFGFLQFETREEAQKVFEMKDFELAGRRVRFDWHNDFVERAPSDVHRNETEPYAKPIHGDPNSDSAPAPDIQDW